MSCEAAGRARRHGKPPGQAPELAWRPRGKDMSNAERHEAAQDGDFVAECRLWRRDGEWQGIADVFPHTDRSVPASLGAVFVQGEIAAVRRRAEELLAAAGRAWRQLDGPAIPKLKHGGDMSLSRERRRQKHMEEAWDAAGRCHGCGNAMEPEPAGKKCGPCRQERRRVKEQSRRLIEEMKKAGRPYPWESLPERGAINPRSGRPYRNSQEGRWLQAHYRRLRERQGSGRPDKEPGRRLFERHLAAEKAQLGAKLAELRARLAAALPVPPWEELPDASPRSGKPYRSSKRTRWIAMRFSYPSERRAAVAKETQSRPEVRQQIAAKAKERWRDPRFKQRVGAQISRRHNSPEGRIKLAGRAKPRMDAENGFVYAIANRSRRGAFHQIGAALDPQQRVRDLRRAGYRDFAAPGDDLELVAVFPCRLFRHAAARLQELLGMDAAHKAKFGEAAARPLAAIRKAARRAIAETDRKPAAGKP